MSRLVWFPLLMLSGCFPDDRRGADHDSGAPDTNADADSDTDTDSDGDADSDADSDTGTRCVSTGFASTAVDWALPTLPLGSASDLAWYQTTGQSARTSGTTSYAYAWRMADIDGDGLEDLVVTYDAAQATVGRSAWSVYRGGPSGFSSSPMSWALPTLPDTVPTDIPWSLFSGQGFRTVDGVAKWFTYATFDLTGDGVLDLVVSYDSAQAGVGSTVWKVYAGTVTGFLAEPEDWALPTLPHATSTDLTWTQTSGSWSRTVDGSTKYVYFQTLDLTGDGVQDLVVTYDAAQPGVGGSQWSVYAGGAAGFASTARAWALPNLPYTASSDPVWTQTTAQTARMVEGTVYYYYYETLDVTGDGRLDLVLTMDRAQPGVGASIWMVYSGTASGFSSTPASWALPVLTGAGPTDLPWATTSGQSFRNVDGVSKGYMWTTLNLTGEGPVDLVVTDDGAAPEVGASVWNVYAGNGTGFDGAAAAWSLPSLPDAGATDLLWYQTAGQSSRLVDATYKGYAWTTTDLTGDGRYDLVLTYDGGQPDVGASRWAVFAAECR